MATARIGSKTKSRIALLCYGEQGTGKSTLAMQLCYMKREDGKPFRVLYIDAENGSIDDYLPDLENDGVDLNNLYIVYSQSISEVREYINKAKNKEDFYVLDEEGEETDEVVVDADGQPFRPDAIVVDGSSILNLTTKHGLVDFSKKRAKVRAEKNSIVGEAKQVAVEGAFLELKDYNIINFKGQDLILDLTGCGLHYIVTAREADEKVSKEIDGEIKTVSTGKKIPEGFKEMGYNVKTEIRLFREGEQGDEEFNIVKAFVKKDRTHTWKEGEIIEDPSLLPFQAVIDKTKNYNNFVVNNNLEKAVDTEGKLYSKELEKKYSISSEEVNEKSKKVSSKDVRDLISKLDTVKKNEAKEKIKEAGLPTAFSKITDEKVLNEIINVIKTVINE